MKEFEYGCKSDENYSFDRDEIETKFNVNSFHYNRISLYDLVSSFFTVWNRFSYFRGTRATHIRRCSYHDGVYRV